MAGIYKVISVDAFGRYDHGDFPSYVSAAGVARIAQKVFPGRISLVLIPGVKREFKLLW